MQASDARKWMTRAFLGVEAAVANELLTLTRVCMTEEYIRTALVRGMMLSRPGHTGSIITEFAPEWACKPMVVCWNNSVHVPNRGRPPQHDIAVMRNNSSTPEILCEVKWIKKNAPRSKEIAKDIWKLAFSRSLAREKEAIRTYFVIGGESVAFSDTLSSMKQSDMNIVWSEAGKSSTPNRRGRLQLGSFFKSTLGEESFKSLMSWGKNPVHFRQPPSCWFEIKATCCRAWLCTIEGTGWRVVLWELNHYGVGEESNFEIDWNSEKLHYPFVC